MKAAKELFWDVTSEEWDYDWKEVFGYAGGPDADSNSRGSIPEAAPIGTNVDTTPFGLDDVAEIYGHSDGENDEKDWIVYGRLNDGRFFSIIAGCDYTGWDCNAGGTASVSISLENITRFGLTKEARERLGIVLDGDK